ncbi:MAG: hypothetical protein LIO77_07435 [Rikenellaceae bacterium]|nr:hypothetical protein [Rikenellaceae bacterium]
MKNIIVVKAFFLALFFGMTSSPSIYSKGSQSNPFYGYITENGLDPVEYIKEKLRDHYVVSLGEDHWIKDHQQYLCSLISALARDTTALLDILALEAGNAADQAIADEFVSSPEYREELAIHILQNAADTYGWPYLESVEIFKAVWEANRANPERQIRIVLLDPPYVIPYTDKESFVYTTTRDFSQMEIIQRHMFQGKRIIFFAGLGHTSARRTGMYICDRDFYWNQHSAGLLLKTLYPSLVFSIKLWGGLMGSGGYIATDDSYRWKRVLDGSVDEAFRMNGNKPVAFDIGGPFSRVTVAEFFHTSSQTLERGENKFTGSPYTREELLQDQIDGILFFKPVEQFSGSTVYEPFFDDQFMERIQKRTEGRISTRKELYEYMKENHPMLGESLDALIAGESL